MTSDLVTAQLSSLSQDVQQLRVRLDGLTARLKSLEDAENYRQQDEDTERAYKSSTFPITPPPELVEQVQQWEEDWHHSKVKHVGLELYIATRAADQELEACLCEVSFIGGKSLADRVRAARRPKPPNLADEALEALRSTPCTEQRHYDALFAALNRLKELEESSHD